MDNNQETNTYSLLAYEVLLSQVHMLILFLCFCTLLPTHPEQFPNYVKVNMSRGPPMFFKENQCIFHVFGSHLVVLFHIFS